MRRASHLSIAVGILMVVVAGCAPGSSRSEAASPSAQTGRLAGIAVAGPTCPVVTDPPQSGCEDRPVEGARLVIVNDEGDQVATATTGPDGRFRVDLPAGGYELQPQPVDGLMGIAPPSSVTIKIGDPTQVTISYDTGIR
ncbi:MAG TPA: carboxypeptidase-like regulatory domain-containing protein [Candidatus Limnocylindria bacterium]|nr:carboxypeptidase-like regulatory domain-containing protein [Candidatus Limnocylindria bacterium]